VSSSQPLATAAGLEILRRGGNAGELHQRRSTYLTVPDKILADAAVATSAALNVTEPSACGIGG
jgi:gamma-glutamyltranspeptidase / glutathione hydrolase